MKIRVGLLAATACGIGAFTMMTTTYRRHIEPRYPASAASAKSKAKAAPAMPANESLAVLIDCHHAMVSRSEGTSQTMTISNPTPFVFQAGSQVLFVTDESIYSVDNSKKELNGHVFQLILPEHNTEASHEFEVRKNGELGSVCCGDGKPTAQRTLPVLKPSAKLTEDTRRALKLELATRIRSVPAQYQNKDKQMEIVAALEKCRNIDFGAQDLVGGLIAKYKARGNNGGYGASGRSSGAKAEH